MAQTRQTKCAVCGQPIRTLVGAMTLRQAPVVCRKCFGQQTYDIVTRTPTVMPIIEQPVGVMEA